MDIESELFLGTTGGDSQVSDQNIQSAPAAQLLSSEDEVRESSNSAIRIAVRCRSHKIPGKSSQRRTTMGNIICQHEWGRCLDENKDFIRTDGFPDSDGHKVNFLLDSGTLTPGLKLEDVPIIAYRWNGKDMCVESNTLEYGMIETDE